MGYIHDDIEEFDDGDNEPSKMRTTPSADAVKRVREIVLRKLPSFMKVIKVYGEDGSGDTRLMLPIRRSELE